MYSSSKENGYSEGLDLIKGDVKLLSKKRSDKLPNVGWKKIEFNNKNSSTFDYLKMYNNEKFYFVHSYKGTPKNKKNILATSSFKDKKICSIVSNNKNIMGTQFHPEKSSFIGLDFLKTVINRYN